jgi:hypothetical protein
LTTQALARPSFNRTERPRGEWLLPAAAIGLTLVLAGLLVIKSQPGQSLMLPAGAFTALIALPLILRKPILGLYILFAAAIIVETDRMPFGFHYTSSIPMFRDLSSISGVEGAWVNPAEIIIVVTGIAWLLHKQGETRLSFKSLPLFTPLTLFMAIVAFSLVRGFLAGADMKTALWIVRPLAYFYLVYLLTQQLLKDRSQVTVLLWIFVIGVAFKGVVGWWRYYVDLGGNLKALGQYSGMNSVMAHEESLFYVGILFLAAIQVMYGAAKNQRLVTLAAVPLVLLPFLANQRRAGTLAFMIGFALFCVMALALLPAKRKLVLGALAAGAIVLPFYAVFSWNAESLASEPVRAVKSGISPEKRDLASNQYRDIENLDLLYTAQHNPLGIGLGKPLTEVKALPDISEQYAWYKIAPHNSLLWLLMATGVAGFAVFWYIMAVGTVLTVRTARLLSANVDKGIAAFAVLMLASLLVFALLDQGLLSMRTMIFTGVLMGAVFSLPRLTASTNTMERTQGKVV